MKSEEEFPLSGSTRLRTRFGTVTVEADEHGEPRIVLEGPQLRITGYAVGDRIDAIFQPGLISLLSLE